ncbi:MAG TPA: undecaprenyl-diphosphate phosphatase [Frankiaceae bacterium]|nr:undecaprenyl-diphosphate phosphatase [Frankiaceae bacterium]
MNPCPADVTLQLDVLQAAVLGITQGISEFLPISSSGHLIAVPWAADWRDVYCAKEGNKFFDVALHMGTFVGAALYLRRDLGALIKAWFRSVARRGVAGPQERLAWFLVLSAIPGALVGAVFGGVLTDHFGHPWQIAGFLAIFGVVLWAADRYAGQATGYEDLRASQVVAMSVAQAAALMPGVSRSGVTITAARLMGVSRDAAARFSFLMSLPIILGAGAYSALSLGDGAGLAGQELQFVVGIVASGISGALAVFGVLSFLRRHTLGAFMWYRLAAAAFMVLLIVSGTRPATI